MADNINLLNDLPERQRFTLTYIQETNVIIGGTGTRTRPPFSRLVVWRPHEQLEPPEDYDVRVDRNDMIVQGKFCPILSIWLILRKITPCG